MIKNLIILLISCFVFLFVLEIAVRLFSDVRTEPHPRDLYIADPDVGYRNNPGYETNFYGAHIRFNNQSIRAERDYGPKDASTFRILLLGDSQTFNGSVPFEDTFGNVLEGLLNAEHGAGAFEVMNAGVSGYGTVNDAAFLKKYGKELDADLIIVGFYINDILENREGISQKTVRDGYLIGTSNQITGNPFQLPYSVKRFLRLHSHLYYFVTYRWDLLKGMIFAPWKAVYERDMPPEIEKDWELSRSYLIGIREWCKSNGKELLVVYIPQALQVEDKLWETMEQSREEYVRDLPNKKLLEYCVRDSISFYDPYPEFREKAGELEIYGKVDKHFSTDGNHLFGKLLFQYMIDHILRGE